MKRHTLSGYDAYMEEWPGGSWVSHEDAEQAERERDEARGKWGAARERLEQAVALLREWREDDGLPSATHTSKRGRTDAFLAGQPAPAPVVDDAMVERAWNAWLEGRGYQDSLRAALVAALEWRG